MQYKSWIKYRELDARPVDGGNPNRPELVFPWLVRLSRPRQFRKISWINVKNLDGVSVMGWTW
jgi:hypothetical protein